MQPDGFKAYDIDDYIVEIYDQNETQTQDVDLLRKLTAELGRLKILEPFCGSGRLLLPLAEDGHHMVGIEKSQPMLAAAKRKIRNLPQPIQIQIKLRHADVTTVQWPVGFDLVILGANCFYELPTAELQEQCIEAARRSLTNGGHLYLDNNHMEGQLAQDWQDLGIIHKNRFPTGQCTDGTRIEGTTERIWFDALQRLVRFRRSVEIKTSNGATRRKEWLEQKHPPSTTEMQTWLEKHGFAVEGLWGDRRQSPYTNESGRAIFWAVKQEISNQSNGQDA